MYSNLLLSRWNLTANAARPNPQGSYHYGTIPIVRTLVLTNSAPIIKGKPRYAINKVSYKNPSTPLKLADYFNISGVFNLNTIKDTSPPGPAVIGTSVVGIELHDFVEIVFQNAENTMQSYHLDGSDFWVVGYATSSLPLFFLKACYRMFIYSYVFVGLNFFF